MVQVQTMIDWNRPAAAPVVRRSTLPLDVRFLQFATDNPAVVQRIIEMARDRKAAGHTWWSMRACFELLREEPHLFNGADILPDGTRVKLNNSFTPLMARLVMRMAPDLEGFFNTR